jgi:paraquat-inducible protein A
MSAAQPVAGAVSEGAVSCHECGLLQRLPAAVAGDVVACGRCGAHLQRLSRQGAARLLPLAVAAALLFVVTNAEPIVRIQVAGSANSATIVDAIMALSAQGMAPLAALVVLTTLVFPAFDLAVLASAALALDDPARVRALTASLRLMHTLRRWAMVEVFMLGVLVSVVKLTAIADVIPGIGLWSLAAYVAVTAAAHASFDMRDYWARAGAPA